MSGNPGATSGRGRECLKKKVAPRRRPRAAQPAPASTARARHAVTPASTSSAAAAPASAAAQAARPAPAVGTDPAAVWTSQGRHAQARESADPPRRPDPQVSGGGGAWTSPERPQAAQERARAAWNWVSVDGEKQQRLHQQRARLCPLPVPWREEVPRPARRRQADGRIRP